MLKESQLVEYLEIILDAVRFSKCSQIHFPLNGNYRSKRIGNNTELPIKVPLLHFETD